MMHMATTVFQFVKLECLIQPIIIQDDADKYYNIENDIAALLDSSNVYVDSSNEASGSYSIIEEHMHTVWGWKFH